MEKIKNILFYAGANDLDYNSIREKIDNSNRILVNVVSGLASVLITALFFLSSFIDGIGMNHTAYGIGSLISLIVLVISLVFAKKHPAVIMPLVHMSYVVFYSYGILIGAITDPGEKTVTFMVMLVFLPVLFTVPPIQMLSITATSSIIFVMLCFKTKTGGILNNDIVDTIIFGLLGSISGVFITYMKIRSYVVETRLHEVSRTDKLTSMNNRNAYEIDLSSIPDRCKKSLGCAYVDVNGLKTLNDQVGHEAGDKMLICVAQKIQQYFGDELTYRVGGDEFIIFAPDVSEKVLRESIENMASEIEDAGYHVAAGWEVGKKSHFHLKQLLNGAEMKMYKAKTLYYKNSNVDRRVH